MSFRNRLTVFFIVLVILPMIVVAAVGFVLASDSEQGKTDARLSEAQRSASGLFRESQDQAEDAARAIARDQQLAAAIQSGERGRSRPPRRARQGAGRRPRRDDPRGRRALRDRARRRARARAHAPDRRPRRERRRAHASAISAQSYAELVERVTGADVVVSAGDDMVVTTLPDAGAERLPESGEVEIGGRALRIAGFDGPGFDGGRVKVRLLAERENGGLAAPRSRSSRSSPPR